MARAPRPGPWTDVPRQHGRTFVVTGASGGLGLETARILAHRGAHVVLAVRNPEKGEAAAATMQRRRGGTPARRLRPRLGARLRRGHRSGGRADQQRRHDGGAVRHQRGRGTSCSSRPTTSATSR